MADFRKLVLALAVLALIAVPASAQISTLQCNTGGTVPTVVRAEGIAEQVGDTVLLCSGTLTADITTNVQIFLNTNVTNKVSGSSITIPTLTIGTTAYNNGVLIGTNSILWAGVTIPAALTAGTTPIIRISGVRANATQAPPAAQGIPGQIIEFISITGPTSVPVFPAQAPVALVQNGLTFSVTNEDVTTFQQCTGWRAGGKDFAADTAPDFTLKYTENIVNAFKNWIDEGADATNGTRLFARFTNVPAGASIWVSPVQVGDSSATVAAQFVGSDPAAKGESAVLPAPPAAYQKVTITGGTGTAVWEVSASNLSAIENLRFGVIVVIPANIALTAGTSQTVNVAGGFAPTSTIHVASSSAPIPRFIEVTSSGALFNITACVTNLLFPYVTNQAGFDTGIAIVNTSKDTGVFDTTPQSGTCTVYYFGAMGNGAQVPGPQTSANVEAGQMVTFLLSTGGVTGATQSAATFQGYLIARCNFQYAHGFAFISGQGVGSVAQGYLALVIPDTTASGGGRAPSPFPEAGGATGEQLGM